jgi:murein DD-endopeptidase MepM/ murein hydrolase activator NlpD
MSRVSFWGIAIIIATAAGCQLPAKTPARLNQLDSTATAPSVGLTSIVVHGEITPQFQDGIEIAGLAVPEPVGLPSPNPDPLRIVFPTPAPVPVSAWRPPLYPTPWAPTPYDHFFFSRPIAADNINWPLADYRYGGMFLPGVVHSGIDIPVDLGTPVLAAGPGRITWAGYGLYRGVEDPTDPYGLAVTIKHDFGYDGETLYTVYGHLERIDVLIGQHVEAGEVLGISGETGKVTGPHLHFEVRVGRNNYFVSRNPELWLSPPQGWGILAARLTSSTGELIASQQATIFSKQTGQTWYVNSYGAGTVNSDPYYRENLVIGDLPAGEYTFWFPYEGTTYNTDVQIRPGMVSYISLRGKGGISTEQPDDPAVEFTPPDSTATPTP